MPLEWVPGTRVTAVVLPQTADVTGDAFVEAAAGFAGASCLDLNDDGLLDNEIGGLTAMLAGFGIDLNVELTKTVAGGGLSLTFVLTPPEAADRLVAYVALAGDESNHWLAQRDAADQPLATLAPVTLDDGILRSSAEELRLDGLLDFFLEGSGLPAPALTLSGPRMTATLDGTVDENGARFVAGTLAGTLFKADIDQALYATRVWCATDPVAPEEPCAYVAMIDLSLLEAFLTWDLDLVGCGKARNVYDPNDPLVIIGHEPDCQAASLCAFWTGEKARVLAAGSQ